VLRDDVVTCIEKLKALYAKQKKLYDSATANMVEAKQHVISGDIESSVECFLKLDEILGFMEAHRFDSAIIHYELSTILGVKKRQIIPTIAEADKKKADELTAAKEASELALEISKQKLTEAIIQIEESMRDLNVDISEISETRKAMEIINH